MAGKGPTLENLRNRLDAVDARIHALLMQRAALSKQVAAAKAADISAGIIPVRMGREARMMRVLAERHSGPFPLTGIFRIWREIIGASASMQAPLRISVAALRDPVTAFDTARGMYGVAAPLTLAESPRQVLRALATGAAQLGVLPEPGQEDFSTWWVSLVDAPSGARIIARLPFLEDEHGHGDVERFVVIAVVPGDPSGADRSLLGILYRNQLSSAALSQRLEQSGLKGHRIAAISAGDGGAYHLAEIDGYLENDDPRLAGLRDGLGTDLKSLAVLGAYPINLGANSVSDVRVKE